MKRRDGDVMNGNCVRCRMYGEYERYDEELS